MSRLHVTVAECKRKEMNKCLEEQFINGLTDDGMIVAIIHKLKPVSHAISVISKQILAW